MIFLRPICWLLGHKRGKLITNQNAPDGFVAQYGYRQYFCPRCGRETRYKIKDQNNGTPGDQA